MASQFSGGELVVLKSGGPVMTVENVSEDFMQPGVFSYGCTWFAGDKHQHSVFAEAAIIRAEDTK